LIIFLTFSLILVTLVAQGLSLPWLVRVLGLTAGNAEFCEEGEARHLVLQAAIDFVGERRKSAKGEHEVHIYEDLLHQYQHRLEDIDGCGPDGSSLEKTSNGLTTNHLLLETIRRQRQELNLLWSGGRIGDNVHRNLERELDLKESLLT
jgi:CPA1 family monovalent cation:H+ antiporter